MLTLKKIAKKLVDQFHLLNDEIFNEIYTLGETETEKRIHDFLDTLGNTGTSKEGIIRRIQKLEESRQSIAKDRLERHLADQKKIEGLLSDIDDLFSKMTIAQNQLKEWEDWNNKSALRRRCGLRPPTACGNRQSARFSCVYLMRPKGPRKEPTMDELEKAIMDVVKTHPRRIPDVVKRVVEQAPDIDRRSVERKGKEVTLRLIERGALLVGSDDYLVRLP
jgi:hypothetical protein